MSNSFHHLATDATETNDLAGFGIERQVLRRHGSQSLTRVQTRQSLFIAFVKCVLYTAVSIYPPFVFVFKLSSYQGNQFTPCNDRTCAFTKIHGEENLTSTVHLDRDWEQMMPVVRNGELAGTDGFVWPPRCPKKSAEAMRELCLLPESMNRIQNSLAKAPSKRIYQFSLFGWFLFKVIHDGLLLVGDFSEFFTMQVGLVSLVFQMGAVAAAFSWTMGATAVFVAPLPEVGHCACYYQLPDLETLLAIANPVFLFSITFLKLANVHRAAVSGDYLYFMTYDVPHRVVNQSMWNPTGPFLIATIRGYQEPVETYKPSLSLHELRFIWALLRMVFDLPLFWGMVSIFAVAVGPGMVRMTVLACSSPSQLLTGSLAVGITIGPCFSLVAHATSFFDFKTGRPLPKAAILEWTWIFRAFMVIVAVAEIACSFLATYVLVTPLLGHIEGHEVLASPRDRLKCGLAGIGWLIFGLVRYIYYKIVMPPYYVLSVKARTPYYPAEYLECAEDFPECNLEEEAVMAEDFLAVHRDSYGLHLHERQEWNTKWEQTIGWPTRSDSWWDGHVMQRCRILAQNGNP